MNFARSKKKRSINNIKCSKNQVCLTVTVELSDGVATQLDGGLRPKACSEALPVGVVSLHLNTPIYISRHVGCWLSSSSP